MSYYPFPPRSPCYDRPEMRTATGAIALSPESRMRELGRGQCNESYYGWLSDYVLKKWQFRKKEEVISYLLVVTNARCPMPMINF
jgi:hypothetical protein